MDWSKWVQHLETDVPPGMPRLRELWSNLPAPLAADDEDHNLVGRFEALLREAAEDGAILVEVRIGNETIVRPGVMECFREAERRVQTQHPTMHAELLVTLKLWHPADELDRVVAASLEAARDGLSGLDLLYIPYETEADWKLAFRICRRAADAGLGITAHAGEFSAANILSALRLPGLTRIGHAVHAVSDPWLLDALLESGVTVECCVTSNVVLGAVRDYNEHPIVRLHDAGVPLVIGTDDPLEFCTSIGNEYAIAASLGVSLDDLQQLTRRAVNVSFASSARRQELLHLLDTGCAEKARAR
jgi:adenosine deaminase